MRRRIRRGVGTVRTSCETYFGPVQQGSPGGERRAGGGQREMQSGVPAKERVAALDGLAQEVAAVQARLGDMRADALGPHVVGQRRDAREEVLETGSPRSKATRAPRNDALVGSSARSAAASRYAGSRA